MGGRSLIEEKLDEIADSGCTPEEACRGFAELLPEVRRRLSQMRAVAAELDALFPVLEDGSDAEYPAFRPTDGDLPRIVGYDVEAFLGRGGMGVIYKARHLRLNRLVALKMLIAGATLGARASTVPARSRSGRDLAPREHRSGL